MTSGRRGPTGLERVRPEVLGELIDAAAALGAKVASVEPPLTVEQITLIKQKADAHGVALVIDTSWRGPEHLPLLDGDAERALLEELMPDAEVVIVDDAFLDRSGLDVEATIFGVLALGAVWTTGDEGELLHLGAEEHALTAGPKKRPAGFSAVRTAAVLARLARGGESLLSACFHAQAFALAAAVEASLPPGEARKIVGLGGPGTRAAARAGETHDAALRHIDDEEHMRLAIEEAAKAAAAGDVPVGAVLVSGGEVIARAHNRREADGDPVAHAELLALQAGAKALGRWRLSGCTLYVTLEPCFMCAGALVNARLERLVIGTLDPKAGATHSLAEVASDPRLNHRVAVSAGVCQMTCAEQLRAFFAERRAT